MFSTPIPSPSPFPIGVFLSTGDENHTDRSIHPQDPIIGFKLNHFMLRIRDPKPSLDFYVNLISMRTVLVMNTGPFTIYYLGYPQTEEHRADPVKFGVETVGKLQHTLELLELYHVHGSETMSERYSTGNEPPNLGSSTWDPPFRMSLLHWSD
jgi:lactoylglutathione lyase